MKKNKTENNASFIGHLTELRTRLIKSFVFLLKETLKGTTSSSLLMKFENPKLNL